MGINIAPEKAKIKNETRKSSAWAIYPTNGGPMNMPAIPYVAIREMAIPGEYFWDPEANVNVIGIIAPVPSPTRQKPIIAGQNRGNPIANSIPKKIRHALRTYVFGIPISSTIRSDAKREIAMQIM